MYVCGKLEFVLSGCTKLTIRNYKITVLLITACHAWQVSCSGFTKVTLALIKCKQLTNLSMEASLRVEAEVNCVEFRAARRFQKRRFEWLRYLTGCQNCA